jgi:hypothetical protein
MKMSTLQTAAVRESLRNAFMGTFFNLSAVADACKVLGRPIYKETPEWRILGALHCKYWVNLNDEERVELVALCVRVLGFDPAENDNTAILKSLPAYQA